MGAAMIIELPSGSPTQPPPAEAVGRRPTDAAPTGPAASIRTGPDGGDAGRTTQTLVDAVRAQLAAGVDLPPLAEGASAARLAALVEWGRQDLSLARVLEAHVDAVQILRERGRDADRRAWYGVWAAEGPSSPLRLRRSGRSFLLEGTKPFCSAAGLVDRALVTAVADRFDLADLNAGPAVSRADDDGDGGDEGDDGAEPAVVLVDVDLRPRSSPGAPRRGDVVVDGSSWSTPAFAATSTATVTFRSVPVARDDLVGPARWYLDRPGFWHGACGPAACWAGGASHLVDAAVEHLLGDGGDDLAAVAAGRLAALDAQNRAVLDAAGRAIDEAPADADAALVRALQVRHSIERACQDVLDAFGQALGPRALALDPVLARQHAELLLYIRQCHAERDLRALGDALRRRPGRGRPPVARPRRPGRR